jgi:cobalt/nickel transport system permease protein
MHIPDGYLSPATCAVGYAASVPFWRIALKRVKKTMNSRQVPLLSLFAALSFVIMMFNLPLPGGTTGHATGIGLATVVIGPWAAMLAVSVALVVQALFFGDGGVTAIGANCFNMAIAGRAGGLCRLPAGCRTVGAGIGRAAWWPPASRAIVAINVSALLAAVEFGIQPLLYKDAAGAPLYCPYPLEHRDSRHDDRPSDHRRTGGTGGVGGRGGLPAAVRLVPAAHHGRQHSRVRASAAASPSKRPLRPLWAGLAILLVLTPLGILAAGSAWGEWMASDYANAAVRREDRVGIVHHAVPARAPQGMERLSSVWTAPFARYAPPYIRGAAFGYLLSAMFGAGLIVVDSCWAVSR